MMAIITTALPLILRLIGWFINRADVKEETKKEWLKFMNTVEKDLDGSVKINSSDEKQKSDINKQWGDKWGKK